MKRQYGVGTQTARTDMVNICRSESRQESGEFDPSNSHPYDEVFVVVLWFPLVYPLSLVVTGPRSIQESQK